MTKKAIIQAIAAVVALLASMLTAIVPGISEEGPMGFPEWTNVGILAAGAVLVYNSANIPGYRWAKLIASIVCSVGVILVSALSDGALTTTEIIQVVAAIAGSAGVGAVRNTGTRNGVFVEGPHRVTPAA